MFNPFKSESTELATTPQKRTKTNAKIHKSPTPKMDDLMTRSVSSKADDMSLRNEMLGKT